MTAPMVVESGIQPGSNRQIHSVHRYSGMVPLFFGSCMDTIFMFVSGIYITPQCFCYTENLLDMVDVVNMIPFLHISEGVLKMLEFFHFPCTYEDINNLAHALILKEALNRVIFHVMDEFIGAMCTMAKYYAHIPMLSRTHGHVLRTVNF